MIDNTELIQRIDAFCKTHNLYRTQFGLECANDGNLYFELRDGRELRKATLDKIESFLKTESCRITAPLVAGVVTS